MAVNFDEITTAFVQNYEAMLRDEAQQRGSKLRNHVVTKPNVVGYRTAVDYIQSTTANDVTTRHGDSPDNVVGHDRRWINLADKDWGTLIDSQDKLRMLVDPTSSYAKAGVMGMGRKIDDVIIASAFASVTTGQDGGSTSTFPAANVVAVDNHTYDAGTGNVPLTVGKLLACRELMESNEVWGMDEPIYCVASPHDKANLLTDSQTTSIYYNQVKALVAGELDEFLGFRFIWSNRLAKDSSGYNRVIAYSQSGLQLAIAQDIKAQIGPDAGKKFNARVYLSMTIGCARAEDARVYEIKCVA